jgi:glutathione peroxidase
MQRIVSFLTLAGVFGLSFSAAGAAEPRSPLDFQVTSIDGKPVKLSKYKGKVVLFVNVASYCGNTKQYANLENLHKKYGAAGLEILGFPANEFGGQEPDTNEKIAEFCTSKYSVDFPMFSKIVVKGDGIAPLYQFLTSPQTDPNYAGPITWNFEKFLVGRNGQIVARFKPGMNPESDEIVQAIENELAKK